MNHDDPERGAHEQASTPGRPDDPDMPGPPSLPGPPGPGGSGWSEAKLPTPQARVDADAEHRRGGAEVVRRRCRFPGCTRPARARNPRGGRPPAYCDDPLHNRASRFALAQADPTPGAGQQVTSYAPGSYQPGSPPHARTGAAETPTSAAPTTPAAPVVGGRSSGHGREQSPDAGNSPDERSSGGSSAGVGQGAERSAGAEGSVLVAALRRAERAEAIADDRARLLDESEARAERREAQLVDRLLVASEQIATLRATCEALRRDDATEPARDVAAPGGGLGNGPGGAPRPREGDRDG